VPNFFEIVFMAIVGAFAGGIAGLLVTYPLAIIFTAGVEGAIWTFLGMSGGAIAGFLAGIVLDLHWQGIGGD
jgi:hypothetical protein